MDLFKEMVYGEGDDLKIKTQRRSSKRALKFIICFIGIFLSYLLFGIIQESLFKNKHGVKKERFVYIISLVFLQSLFNAFVARFALSCLKLMIFDPVPQRNYAMCALFYMLAMFFSNEALKFMSYPAQVLGKSVKPVSVMLMGTIFARKRYPLSKYVCVLLIVIGVAMFTYKRRPDSNSNGNLLGIGEILIIFSLIFDGLTAATQDRMKSSYSVNAYKMMYSMNIWATLWALVGSVLLREAGGFLNFIYMYPEVLKNIFILNAAGALGQIFIFLTVEWFGPLMCSVTTTTRKFFTILCSVIFFRNPLSIQQWVATSLVFLGLTLENFIKQRKTVVQ